jgi:Flp pilus assembly protein TadG
MLSDQGALARWPTRRTVKTKLTFWPHHRGMKRIRCIGLRGERRGVTTVEFALVCAPFTIFLLAVMLTGLQFYLQQALDFATESAVRQVQLGNVSAGYTEADFVNNVFCPIFGSFQACSNLYIDLRPVSDYEQLTNPGLADAPGSASTTGLVFCPGTAGQLMYAHIIYLAPSIVGTLFGNTAGYSAIVSNAAFAIENPIGTAVLPVQGNGC